MAKWKRRRGECLIEYVFRRAKRRMEKRGMKLREVDNDLRICIIYLLKHWLFGPSSLRCHGCKLPHFTYIRDDAKRCMGAQLHGAIAAAK